MRASLLRKLNKLTVPGFWRAKHDYFPRTLKLHNGEKCKQLFSSKEMDRRLNRIRDHMEKDGIDACVFTSYHNIYYFSDFLYCSMGRDYAMIVTDEKAITITPSVDYGYPWRRTTCDNISYTNWNKDNFYQALQQQLQSAKTVGFEFPEMGGQLKSFSEALPQAKFVDVTEPAMLIRRVKSPEEIEIVRQGSRIAELGAYAGIKALHEGVPEYEVTLASTNTMVREIAANFPHIDIRDTWSWLQSGINTDGAHNFPTSRRVQKGDILSLNCFPMIAGNYSVIERTLFFDHVPSDRHMELWEINNKVHRKGLELVKPGVRCGNVAQELNEIYMEHDILQYRVIGYGHSTGVLSHYYGRDWGLEFLEHVDTVLEPGMVITMEPMIVVPEGHPGAGGYREHDTLIITETGVENTTASFPIGPDQNIVKN
ncbi:creatinase-like [Oculina patagonica]